MICAGPIWVDPHSISEALLGGHLSICRDNLHGNRRDIGYPCGGHSYPFMAYIIRGVGDIHEATMTRGSGVGVWGAYMARNGE